MFPNRSGHTNSLNITAWNGANIFFPCHYLLGTRTSTRSDVSFSLLWLATYMNTFVNGVVNWKLFHLYVWDYRMTVEFTNSPHRRLKYGRYNQTCQMIWWQLSVSLACFVLCVWHVKWFGLWAISYIWNIIVYLRYLCVGGVGLSTEMGCETTNIILRIFWVVQHSFSSIVIAQLPWKLFS